MLNENIKAIRKSKGLSQQEPEERFPSAGSHRATQRLTLASKTFLLPGLTQKLLGRPGHLWRGQYRLRHNRWRRGLGWGWPGR